MYIQYLFEALNHRDRIMFDFPLFALDPDLSHVWLFLVYCNCRLPEIEAPACRYQNKLFRSRFSTSIGLSLLPCLFHLEHRLSSNWIPVRYHHCRGSGKDGSFSQDQRCACMGSTVTARRGRGFLGRWKGRGCQEVRGAIIRHELMPGLCGLVPLTKRRQSSSV